MKIVRQLNESAWREFVEEHPFSNIFHTPEMFQVFTQAKGYQPTLWAATNDEGKVLALLLPVQITLMDGWLRPLTTRAVAYGSVLYASGPEGEAALATLLRTYTQDVGRALFTELRNLADLSSVQPLLNECGFVYEDHLDYLIDLNRPVEELMQSIGPRTRKHIRRSLKKQEVNITEISEQGGVLACYNLLQKSYAVARVPIPDYSLFEAAFEILHPRGMVKFWLACVDDCAAASVELVYKDIIYGWYGGINRDYANQTPGELLMWQVLKWGAENGYRMYDFGGAGKPGEEYGVRDFKAKFGGELVCYGRNVYVHSPHLLTLSKYGYEIYRRLLLKR